VVSFQLLVRRVVQQLLTRRITPQVTKSPASGCFPPLAAVPSIRFSKGIPQCASSPANRHESETFVSGFYVAILLVRSTCTQSNALEQANMNHSIIADARELSDADHGVSVDHERIKRKRKANQASHDEGPALVSVLDAKSAFWSNQWSVAIRVARKS
jgi:hypothetical protein